MVLTLDHRLQLAAEAALDREHKTGAVVALDPRNGEVLALASRPALRPERLRDRRSTRERWRSLTTDPQTPLMNRALQGQYPPGSTYKVVTAIGGLEEKLIGQHSDVFCGGSFRLGRRTYRCWKHGRTRHRRPAQGDGPVVRRVLLQASGSSSGVNRLAYYARALGLGSRTGIELSGEMGGLVPTKEWKERRDGTPWVEGDTVSVSIGQGVNLWTPLQLATAYAAIANGGTRYRPHVLKRIEEPDGADRAHRSSRRSLGEVPVSPQTLALVRSGPARRRERAARHGRRDAEPARRRRSRRARPARRRSSAWPQGARIDSEDLARQHRDHAWFVTYAAGRRPAHRRRRAGRARRPRRQRGGPGRARGGRALPRSARQGTVCRELTVG